ncbi:MAG: bacillithiol biosynthesis cysteine-adding enzyme BshC [Acidobacteria bacterium]|nr:bacillithiol biosynthesis cysteine-adding enzyme BshC [Acidobacteriota bacterium]MBK9708438.1 bacillithiol biosynthesis cysteine-adding enzyme BshC [Acidobacteriota bacterium]
MSINAIRFSDIPRTSRLFADYLYDFGKVSKFYQPEGLNLDSLITRAEKVLSQTFSRDAVADVLMDENRLAGAGEKTFANIEKLRRSDSVVIITGQQAGLFTGPLYTVFKALTAIKLAAYLCDKGINAVPMFWIASEDHDFEEVNHTYIVNREGRLSEITYDAGEAADGRPVGNIPLDDEILKNIEQMILSLPESEFMPKLVEDLQESYKTGNSFASSFGNLMMRWLSRFGVVLINPLDDRLKEIAGEIYSRAMTRLPEFSDHLVKASAELEASGYHAQVFTSPEAVPLFMIDEGKRTAMTFRSDGRFHLKGSDRSFEAKEVIDTVARCPACFSPNVTLRPIVQDFLLPTLAYIGGPSEIAYFAQIRSNYSLLGRIEPAVFPRASFTLMEKRMAKSLNKFNLQLKDLFGGQEEVAKIVVERGLDQNIANQFDETERIFDEQIEKLKLSLTSVDPTLAEALKGGREKILYQLHNLRTRFINNRSKRDETTGQQLDKLVSALYPNKNLQEREINMLYFLSRYGYELIDRIYDEIDLNLHDHKLIYL